MPGLQQLACYIEKLKAEDQLLNIWSAGSARGYGDDRSLGEKAKDALPGTGRGSSHTGHSSGQGYTQEGRGVTSGTGKSFCVAGIQ